MKQISKENCCGCFACVSKCPKKAISVIEDETGFLYPSIDENACIDCGACTKVCEFIKEKETENNSISAYGLQHNSREALYNSTSGGAFTAVSDIVLDMGGCIVGAVTDKDFNVHHAVADTKEERDLMRGSKYVQSSTEGIYDKIEERLKKGQTVLFTGTPCQTAATMSYFDGKYEHNLITVDILCHGVPSVKMFKDHIKYIAEKSGKTPSEYIFRSKEFGWRATSIEGTRFAGSDKTTFSEYMQRLSRLFYSGASLRPSCHNCKYRTKFRYSDVTVADFWGIDKIASGKNNLRGHSLLFVNSDNGKWLIDNVLKSETADVFEVEVSDVLYRLPEKPANPIKNQEEFWSDYTEHGYDYIIGKYTDTSIGDQLRFNVKKFLRRHDY